MSNLPATLPLKKLSIWQTIQEAFEVSWRHRTALGPWLVLWVMVLGLPGYLIENSFLDIEMARKEGSSSWERLELFFWLMLLAVSRMVAFVYFAVWWHRKVLLVKGEKGNSRFFSFSERENKFFWYVFGVGCIATLAMLPGIIFLGLLNAVSGDLHQFFEKQRWLNAFIELLVIYAPSMYVVGKYCLIFPATAVSFNPIKEWSWPANLTWSEERAKGNEWQLAFLAGAVPVLFEWITKAIMLVFGIDQEAFIASIVFSLLWFPLIPIEIAVLSIAFRELTNWTSTLADKENVEKKRLG